MKYSGEHLFVYGTLLLPQIMQRVSGQGHFSRPAVLHGYARYGLRGKRYPGIVPAANTSVAGILYLNIRPAAWQRLDAYEDYFYMRQGMQVEVAAGEYLQAWSYVIPEHKRGLLAAHDWSLQQFRQRYLQGFLQHMSSRRRY